MTIAATAQTRRIVVDVRPTREEAETERDWYVAKGLAAANATVERDQTGEYWLIIEKV